jgi:PAS domain S-box-containing protein
VVETATDAIFQSDPRGYLTFVNQTVVQRNGYSEEELIGKHFLDLVRSDYRARVEKFYAAQFAERLSETYCEFPIVTKAGKAVWVGQNVKTIEKDGKIIGFQAIARDITDRKKAEDQLKAALKEKEVLMREIHHRVKNNFQVVSSILELQAGRMRDRRCSEALRDTEARILAMAMIHERLYESESLARIAMDEYLASIAKELVGFYGAGAGRIELHTEIEEISFCPDTAIPCGLIVTELLTNAMKHAFRKGEDGRIEISLHSGASNRYKLTVSDNGVGVPRDFQPWKTDSLGLNLVDSFVKKLKGAITIKGHRGVQFSITFGPIMHAG